MKTPLTSKQLTQRYDTPVIAKDGYSGHIPPTAFNALEWEAAGLMHGKATLTLYIKDGNLNRFVTSRKRSFVSGKPTTGGAK